MVKMRPRTDPETEKAIAQFAAQAEQPVVRAVPDLQEPAESTPLPQSDPTDETEDAQEADSAPTESKAPSRTTPRRRSGASSKPDADAWKRRNREPKHGGINFRVSSSQLELLRQAALAEEISQQKVLERLIWPILEERYGNGASE